MSAAAALHRCAQVVDAAAYRNVEAVGIRVDNLDDPHAICIVHDGETIYEQMSPALGTLPPEQQADIIRAVRFIAHASWAAQRRAGATP